MEKALAFLKEHINVALATVENVCPKIRVFQIMKQKGAVFYFASPVLHRFHDTYRTIAYFSIAAQKVDYYDLGTSPLTFESYSLI